MALVAALVAVAAFLLVRGYGDDPPDEGSAADPTSSAPPVASDEAWCTGWENLVAVQGQYVSSPSAETASMLLAVVADLRSLGVPESLDPSGYRELNAVLDDVQASVDPSFTPSVVPSEPADVQVEGDEHEDEHEDEHGDDHEDHGADAGEAPFGAWLAEYCQR
ncbi:hypothetical protein D0Z08_22750 [Nocardioides immobilis]|uniref:Uncharacterized protein n=2 Tax=Nocardioides immobilis TaxID=2049295 RepID=A0A417XWL1_9ACTN|nr:hypothetical protein D0Z08_22750 [Nocardioides immobilis]